MSERDVADEADNSLFDIIKIKKSISDSLYELLLSSQHNNHNTNDNEFERERGNLKYIDDRIITSLNKMPKAVRLMDNNDNYPLHLLCGCWQFENGMVQKVLDMFPDAAKQKNADGDFPLHIAIYHGYSEGVIMKLIDICPEAALSKSSFDDMYAVDLASQHVECIQVRKKLVEVYAEGRPLLQAIIARQPTSEILDLIEQEPMAVQLRHTNGNYALHEALYRHSSDDEGNVVIMKLLEVFPQAAQLQDGEGWYPLHIACRHSKPSNVILRLIEIYPEAVAAMLPDGSGRYLLHKICQGHYWIRDDVIPKLLEVFPQALQSPDAEGWYPLHLACRHVNNDNLILKLIEIYPEAAAAQLPDASGGSYPLHLACKSNDNYTTGIIYDNGGVREYISVDNGHVVIMKLLEVFPQAAQFPDAKGWYPLHIACDNTIEVNEEVILRLTPKVNEEAMLRLIEIYPEAAAAQLPDASGGGYPLHIACQNWKADTVIMKLLEVFPQAAHFPNVTGQYPLHIACQNAKTEETILKLIEIHPDAVAKTVHINNGHQMFNPLQLLALRDYHANVVKYLLTLPDLDVNATNSEGDSALHIAIDVGSFKIVDALLCHPFIIIDQWNHDNKTPFDLVDKKISELRNLDDDHYRKRKRRLRKYQKVKKQLEDHLVMTRWGSFEYFYQNVEDWSMNQ